MSDTEPEILRDAERATDERDEIVVGLDTSPAANAALRWAAEYARAVGVSLRAVTIVDWPTGMTSEGTPLMEAIGYCLTLSSSRIISSRCVISSTRFGPSKIGRCSSRWAARVGYPFANQSRPDFW